MIAFTLFLLPFVFIYRDYSKNSVDFHFIEDTEKAWKIQLWPHCYVACNKDAMPKVSSSQFSVPLS